MTTTLAGNEIALRAADSPDEVALDLTLVEPVPGEAFAGPSGVPGQPQVRDIDRFSGHAIHLQLFEGPLDLLLYLIRAHRYDVCDIPIHEITAQFLEFLSLMDEIDLEYAGDFLVTAATLMQIKSRMLLPHLESVNEDEMDEGAGDPRRQLVQRLLEYQRFQEAAAALRDMRDERSQLFARPPMPVGADLPADDGAMLLQDVSTFDLLRALQKVLARLAERPVALVRREPFSVPERMRDLLDRVTRGGEGLTFGALCDDCQSRLEVVITFLAVLELIRRGKATVSQPDNFDEIWIAPRPGIAPPVRPLDSTNTDDGALDTSQQS